MEKIELFKNKIKEIYPDAYDEIINTHSASHMKSFRINKLISNSESVISSLEKEGFGIKYINFVDAYVCINNSENKKLSESNAAKNNEIYIQELSSMIPALVLDLKEDENILDLCAAPGSKTTQMAVITRNKSNIVAVEKSRDRFFKMQKIIAENKVENVKIINIDSNLLIKKYPEYENYFDKVLVDVPCTNEGGVNLNEKDSLKFWHPHEAKKISKLQKGLLNNAVKMLKKGGVLVYSTCTYSVDENEMVVNWILKRQESRIENLESGIQNQELGILKLVEINLDLENVRDGFISWKGKELNSEIKRTKRVIPNEYFRGFYIAKFTKI